MLGQVLPLLWDKGHSNQIVSQSVSLCNQTHLYHTICVSSTPQPHLIPQCHTTLGQLLPLLWGKGHSNRILSQSVTLYNQTHLYHTICVSSSPQPHLISQCHTTLGQVLPLLWGKGHSNRIVSQSVTLYYQTHLYHTICVSSTPQPHLISQCHTTLGQVLPPWGKGHTTSDITVPHYGQVLPLLWGKGHSNRIVSQSVTLCYQTHLYHTICVSSTPQPHLISQCHTTLGQVLPLLWGKGHSNRIVSQSVTLCKQTHLYLTICVSSTPQPHLIPECHTTLGQLLPLLWGKGHSNQILSQSVTLYKQTHLYHIICVSSSPQPHLISWCHFTLGQVLPLLWGKGHSNRILSQSVTLYNQTHQYHTICVSSTPQPHLISQCHTILGQVLPLPWGKGHSNQMLSQSVTLCNQTHLYHTICVSSSPQPHLISQCHTTLGQVLPLLWGKGHSNRIVSQSVTLCNQTDLYHTICVSSSSQPHLISQCHTILGQVLPLPWGKGHSNQILSQSVTLCNQTHLYHTICVSSSPQPHLISQCHTTLGQVLPLLWEKGHSNRIVSQSVTLCNQTDLYHTICVSSSSQPHLISQCHTTLSQVLPLLWGKGHSNRIVSQSVTLCYQTHLYHTICFSSTPQLHLISQCHTTLGQVLPLLRGKGHSNQIVSQSVTLCKQTHLYLTICVSSTPQSHLIPQCHTTLGQLLPLLWGKGHSNQILSQSVTLYKQTHLYHIICVSSSPQPHLISRCHFILGQVLPLLWGKGHSNRILSQSVTLYNQTHLYHTICVSSTPQPHLISQCHTILGQVLPLPWG
ncbi:hypothetical protein J6590_091049 [Homalodisca vitripennis]|nr:hypothetical protein J6590_091049 [Homalodisca vitripennis]